MLAGAGAKIVLDKLLLGAEIQYDTLAETEVKVRHALAEKEVVLEVQDHRSLETLHSQALDPGREFTSQRGASVPARSRCSLRNVGSKRENGNSILLACPSRMMDTGGPRSWRTAAAWSWT